MSQFDFGTIDPYVVDGVQLAGMLNQWRDAIHSWHRGPTRPAYVVPGMMWINDSAGAANWVVNVFMGVTIGDVPLFTYNTSTGAINIAPGSGGFAANLITAIGTTPTLAFNDIDNPIDQKRWQFTVNSVGGLVLSTVNDAGAVGQSFVFNRNGTLTVPGAPPVLTGDFCAMNVAGGGLPVSAAVLSSLTVISGNSGGWFSGSRYTPPAGRYHIFAQYMANSSAASHCDVLIRKNATTLHTNRSTVASASFWANPCAIITDNANGTDYYEMWVGANGGGNASYFMFGAFPVPRVS